MKKKKAPKIQNNNEEKCKSIFDYIVVLLVVFFTLLLAVKLDIKNDETKVKILMAAALVILGAYAVFLKQTKRLTDENAAALIIIAGMVMRIGYMLYTHMFTRGHDLGSFDETGTGHLGYILNLLDGHLPRTNENQFYHPPFFHMTAALFAKIGQIFCSNTSTAFEFSQTVNCAASCFMLIALRNFADEISINGKYKLYLFAIISFFPNFYLMGGRLNNDMICTFCMLLCMINTYRWYKNRDMKTIICLALSFGIGMMTKISCGTMALITGPVMIYCLVCDFKKKEYKSIISQLAVFALICFPLALWYPIRNLILFGQPLNYVLEIGEDSIVYTGNTLWYKRFFYVSLPRLMKQVFADINNDYSIPMRLIRSAVAGEFTFDGMDAGFRILIILNILLTLISAASIIYVLINDKELEKKLRYGLLVIGAVIIGTFIQFNIAYPCSCTADIRYIPLAPIIGACYIAYAIRLADDDERKYVKYLRIASKCIIVLWCIFSCAVYI